MSGGRYSVLSVIFIVTWIVLWPTVKGYKVRACAGQEAHLNCSSGLHVDVISAVGGFGQSGTQCTSTASCTTSCVQGVLPNVYGSLNTFIKTMCNYKSTCDVVINSTWQAPTTECNNKTYNVSYVDVEYNCTSMTTATPLRTTSTPERRTITRKNIVTELHEDDTTSANTTVGTDVKNTTVSISVTISTEQVTDVHEAEQTNLNTGAAWWWYIVGGGAGVSLIVIIIVIVVVVRRKRGRQENKMEHGQNPSIEEVDGQSNDVMPHATPTTASFSDNAPDTLYDDLNTGDGDDDVRSSTIHCYATTSNKTNDVHSPDDVSTSNDVSVDVPVYASVHKDKKRDQVSFDTVVFDNENYIAS